MESSLFYFYTTHSFFERIPVMTLCRFAKVSTPSFYRHYHGLLDVVEAGHQRIRQELRSEVEGANSLVASLARVFQFVLQQPSYYKTGVFQMSLRPFVDIMEILRPKIRNYLEEKYLLTGAKQNVQKACYEIEAYIIADLQWWISRENLSREKIAAHIDGILRFIKKRLRES